MQGRSKRASTRAGGVAAVCFVAIAVLAPSARAGLASQADARLDDGLQGLVDMRGGPPGAAAIVDRGNGVGFHRAGVGIVSSGRPWRRRDYLRIASNAKAFSGAVALGLVDRGMLSLDDTIGQVLPSLPVAWSQVTLRELLNHTGGLPEYTASDGFREALTANPRGYLSPQQVVSFVADKPLDFAPGTQYHYSDTDNIVIALMAEAVSGTPYETLLSQFAYGPSGLRATSLPDGYLIPRPYVHGYETEAGKPPENVSQFLSASGAWSSGGIVSTLPDLNRFIRGWAAGTQLSPAVRAEQIQFVPGGASGPPGPGDNSAGLGIFQYEASCGTVYGAAGNFPGYTTFIAASADGSRSTVVSINLQVNELSPNRLERVRHVWDLAVCAALP